MTKIPAILVLGSSLILSACAETNLAPGSSAADPVREDPVAVTDDLGIIDDDIDYNNDIGFDDNAVGFDDDYIGFDTDLESGYGP